MNDNQVIKEFGRAWSVECEKPNEYLHRFDGILKNTDGTSILITPENFLLRGSCLRNTQHVYGIAVFTGHETKVMKNSMQSKMKYSKIEKMTNTYIWIIMIIQIVLCLGAGTYFAFWKSLYAGQAPYLDYSAESEDFTTVLVISFGQWFLIMMNFVPISLIVTLEIVKFWQAIFFSWDVQMYDISKDMPCTV
jgi:magnesium-transporting ATPase (P-type)